MASQRHRERSRSELAFILLRTLVRGYQLWGPNSALPLAALPNLLDTRGGRFGEMLIDLASEGWIAIDRSADTVRLSAAAARDFLESPPPDAGLMGY